MRARALLLAVLVAAGCQRPTATLQMSYETDAGLGVCAPFDDLACVNFIRFQATVGEDFITHCVKVTEHLKTLCDLDTLAAGAEIFREDQDKRITITMEGLRAFPADSCEFNAACPPRTLFTGTTALDVRVGDVAGKRLKLSVGSARGCGWAETFEDLQSDCDTACATYRGNTVTCPPPNSGFTDVAGGCVCACVPDGGLPLADGAAAPTDGAAAADARPRDAAGADAASPVLDAGVAPLVDAAAPDAPADDAAAPDGP